MFCLVYKSIADPVLEQSDIQEMLEKARDFNELNDITGCLLYYNGVFIQYLEGNHVDVITLFDRIKEDSRHRKVELISHNHSDSREFESWNMAFENFYGDNDQLQFLKFLMRSYIEDPDSAVEPNPTSKFFWKAAGRLLNVNSEKEFK